MLGILHKMRTYKNQVNVTAITEHFTSVMGWSKDSWGNLKSPKGQYRLHFQAISVRLEHAITYSDGSHGWVLRHTFSLSKDTDKLLAMKPKD